VHGPWVGASLKMYHYRPEMALDCHDPRLNCFKLQLLLLWEIAAM